MTATILQAARSDTLTDRSIYSSDFIRVSRSSTTARLPHAHRATSAMANVTPCPITMEHHSVPPSTDTPAKEPKKRTRKSHNKTRTGCFTCKIRRKKCDETKPACERCTSTGRRCDGYAAVVAAAPAAVTRQPSEVAEGYGVATSPDVHRGLQCESGKCGSDIPVYQGVLTRSAAPGVGVLAGPRVVEVYGGDSGYATADALEIAGAIPGLEGVDLPLLDHDEVDDVEVDDFILGYPTETITTTTINHASQPSSRSSPHDSLDRLTPTSSSQPPISSRRLHPKRRNPTHFSPFAPLTPPLTSPHLTNLTPHQLTSFTHFTHRTAPQFASYFDSSLWRHHAIPLALTSPVLFACAAALGAVHHRFSLGITPAAMEWCGIAEGLYRGAVRGLGGLRRGLEGGQGGGGGDGGRDGSEIVATAELLLGLFLGFQGDFEGAVGHVKRGLIGFLARPMTVLSSETRYCAIDGHGGGNVFVTAFERLRWRSEELLEAPTRILVHWGPDVQLPEIPRVFRSLEETRDYIFTEVEWIMREPVVGWRRKGGRDGRGGRSSRVHDGHVVRLLQWSVAYAELMKGFVERTGRQKKAGFVLKMVRGVLHLLMYVTYFMDREGLCDRDETEMGDGGLAGMGREIWDVMSQREELSTNFARCWLMVEGHTEDGGMYDYDEHTISFDTSIGPPRGAEVVPESSGKTRHLVKLMMMMKGFDDQALWEVLGVYGVAEKLSAVEEHAVIEAARSIIPAHIDPRWVDVTFQMDRRRMLLRYCRPDDYGLGMVWTLEWYAY